MEANIEDNSNQDKDDQHHHAPAISLTMTLAASTHYGREIQLPSTFQETKNAPVQLNPHDENGF